MPNFWVKDWKFIILWSWVIWCICVMPFSFQGVKFSGFLFIVKSGLFQIGECEDGVTVEFLMWWVFHQAVRAEAMVIFWKQVLCLIELLMNGRSERFILSHSACSVSIQWEFESEGMSHCFKYFN